MQQLNHWAIDDRDLKVEHELGKGSFGVVCRGSYLGTPVAIKRLYETEGMEKYWAREIAVLMQLKHPNIVQMLGLAMSGEDILIVTEFVEAGDVHSKICNPAYSFNWKMRLSILLDVARAMSYLHSKDRMHRDLKSANLLLAKDWICAKVCDFGLARERPPEADEEVVLTVAGTPPWMAPEMLSCERYSLPADVFSYGMVIYELIFNDGPPMRHLKDGYAFDVKRCEFLMPGDTPEGLEDLLLACANKDPPCRPSFSDVLDKLEGITAKIQGRPEWSFDGSLDSSQVVELTERRKAANREKEHKWMTHKGRYEAGQCGRLSQIEHQQASRVDEAAPRRREEFAQPVRFPGKSDSGCVLC